MPRGDRGQGRARHRTSVWLGERPLQGLLFPVCALALVYLSRVVLVQQGRATSGGEQHRPEADQAPTRTFERDDGTPGIALAQVGDATLPGSQGLGDGADVLVGYVVSNAESSVRAFAKSPES